MATELKVAVGDEVRFMLRSQYRFGIVKEIQPRKKRARVKFGEGLRWIPLDDLVVRRQLSATQTTKTTSPSNSNSTSRRSNSKASQPKSATGSSTKSRPKKAAASKRRSSKASRKSISTKKQK